TVSGAATGSDGHSFPVQLTTFDAAAGTATLTNPPDGAVDVAVQAMLTWTAASQASTYQVQVDNNNDFSSPEVDVSGLPTTSYTATTLSPNTTYFWHVKATNPCGAGSFSSTFTFTTVNIVCSHPNLAIPDNVPAGVSDTMTFTDATQVNRLE